MGRPVKSAAAREHGDETGMRDQEVLRANKELAAYFRGRRTEREARAAVKIIKAFIRDREHADPKHRRPLPGAEPPAAPVKTRKAAAPRKRAVRRLEPHVRDQQTARPRTPAGEPVKRDAPSGDESS